MRRLKRAFFVQCDGSQLFQETMLKYLTLFDMAPGAWTCREKGAYYGKDSANEKGLKDNHVCNMDKDMGIYRKGNIITFAEFDKLINQAEVNDVNEEKDFCFAVLLEPSFQTTYKSLWNRYIDLMNEYDSSTKWLGSTMDYYYCINTKRK